MGFLKITLVITVAVAIFAYVSLPGFPDTANNRNSKEIKAVFMNVILSVVSVMSSLHTLFVALFI